MKEEYTEVQKLLEEIYWDKRTIPDFIDFHPSGKTYLIHKRKTSVIVEGNNNFSFSDFKLDEGFQITDISLWEKIDENKFKDWKKYPLYYKEQKWENNLALIESFIYPFIPEKLSYHGQSISIKNEFILKKDNDRIILLKTKEDNTNRVVDCALTKPLVINNEIQGFWAKSFMKLLKNYNNKIFKFIYEHECKEK